MFREGGIWVEKVLNEVREQVMRRSGSSVFGQWELQCERPWDEKKAGIFVEKEEASGGYEGEWSEIKSVII